MLKGEEKLVDQYCSIRNMEVPWSYAAANQTKK